MKNICPNCGDENVWLCLRTEVDPKFAARPLGKLSDPQEFQQQVMDNLKNANDDFHPIECLSCGSTWGTYESYMEDIKALKHYRVSLYEDPGDKFKIIFNCMATDADHADEQAMNMYPGCEIIITAETTEGATP